ncbi:amino acid ABC transporter substrate-binding protein (PAAT family) [Rhizobium sp. ERR 922]|nr:amino acid ABC transporter substrate-binding protein (PAAT family) [Rhizobium sp. ERR 922]TWB92645.1 amino acid ABC transporter substrate-binding protein (PAAT family) [Rhizobium sp. ERR 942]
MRVCLSSIMSAARHLALTALIAMSCTLPLAAQETKPQSLPILFDARERLPKPDLSSLVRLRFLTSIDFPPFNFLDQNGKLTGFHVELARKICDELAIADKCQIQALPFGELQGALAASQGDAVIAGVAVTPELRKTFAFSRPFLMLPARFVRNLKASIGGTTAASLSGHPVGVVKGTVHEAMLTAFFPAIKPVPFDDKDGLLAAVKDGKVDAAFADGLQLSFWVSSPAAEKCCALFDGPYLSQQFLGEGMTIMLRQQDADLTAAINHALATLSRDGRLQEIYLRYFPYGLY